MDNTETTVERTRTLSLQNGKQYALLARVTGDAHLESYQTQYFMSEIAEDGTTSAEQIEVTEATPFAYQIAPDVSGVLQTYSNGLTYFVYNDEKQARVSLSESDDNKAIDYYSVMLEDGSDYYFALPRESKESASIEDLTGIKNLENKTNVNFEKQGTFQIRWNTSGEFQYLNDQEEWESGTLYQSSDANGSPLKVYLYDQDGILYTASGTVAMNGNEKDYTKITWGDETKIESQEEVDGWTTVTLTITTSVEVVQQAVTLESKGELYVATDDYGMTQMYNAKPNWNGPVAESEIDSLVAMPYVCNMVADVVYTAYPLLSAILTGAAA
jgi:hypothetical protein